jgi:hypothetical protein
MSEKMTYGDNQAEQARIAAEFKAPNADRLFRPFLVETPGGWFEAQRIPGIPAIESARYELLALKVVGQPGKLGLLYCHEFGVFTYGSMTAQSKDERVTKYESETKAWFDACSAAAATAEKLGFPQVTYPATVKNRAGAEVTVDQIGRLGSAPLEPYYPPEDLTDKIVGVLESGHRRSPRSESSPPASRHADSRWRGHRREPYYPPEDLTDKIVGVLESGHIQDLKFEVKEADVVAAFDSVQRIKDEFNKSVAKLKDDWKVPVFTSPKKDDWKVPVFTSPKKDDWSIRGDRYECKMDLTKLAIPEPPVVLTDTLEDVKYLELEVKNAVEALEKCVPVMPPVVAKDLTARIVTYLSVEARSAAANLHKSTLWHDEDGKIWPCQYLSQQFKVKFGEPAVPNDELLRKWAGLLNACAENGWAASLAPVSSLEMVSTTEERSFTIFSFLHVQGMVEPGDFNKALGTKLSLHEGYINKAVSPDGWTWRDSPGTTAETPRIYTAKTDRHQLPHLWIYRDGKPEYVALTNIVAACPEEGWLEVRRIRDEVVLGLRPAGVLDEIVGFYGTPQPVSDRETWCQVLDKKFGVIRYQTGELVADLAKYKDDRDWDMLSPHLGDTVRIKVTFDLVDIVTGEVIRGHRAPDRGIG